MVCYRVNQSLYDFFSKADHPLVFTLLYDSIIWDHTWSEMKLSVLHYDSWTVLRATRAGMLLPRHYGAVARNFEVGALNAPVGVLIRRSQWEPCPVWHASSSGFPPTFPYFPCLSVNFYLLLLCIRIIEICISQNSHKTASTSCKNVNEIYWLKTRKWKLCAQLKWQYCCEQLPQTS